MSGRPVFVDTGAWLAAFHRRDQYHAAASALLRRLRTERARLVVTNLVLAELHLHLVHALGPQRAAHHLETIKFDPLIDEITADGDLQAAALADWIHRLADQPFTLTDAVSFAAMRGHKIATAFTFDRHFRAAGFHIMP